jgi:hypothetical protein
MRSAKLLGGAVLAAVALMAIAGTASATVLTGKGEEILKVGTKGKAVSEGPVVLSGTINITCQKSVVEGEITNAGSSTTTVEGKVTSLTFQECGSSTVTVLELGTAVTHTDSESANGNGVSTGSGGKATILTHNVLGTVHCIYTPPSTENGTILGSINNEGGAATVTGESVPVPQSATDFGCGSEASGTAKYVNETPAYVDVD